MCADGRPDREVVEAALLHIRHDGADGVHTYSDLAQLYGRTMIAQSRGTISMGALRQLAGVVHYQMELVTIVAKLDWLNARREKDLDVARWMAFATSDVVGFHVTARSLFDEVARFAGHIAAKRGVVPASFHDLRGWTSKPGNRVRLGAAMSDVVESCEWFEELRDLRDDLVHRGAMPIVFGELNQIHFQVGPGRARSGLIPAVMAGENVLDFRNYAALVMARLDRFLCYFAQAVFDDVKCLRDVGPQEVRNGHAGLPVLAVWLEGLLQALDEES